jgi:hypothetical protein
MGFFDGTGRTGSSRDRTLRNLTVPIVEVALLCLRVAPQLLEDAEAIDPPQCLVIRWWPP